MRLRQEDFKNFFQLTAELCFTIMHGPMVAADLCRDFVPSNLRELWR